MSYTIDIIGDPLKSLLEIYSKDPIPLVFALGSLTVSALHVYLNQKSIKKLKDATLKNSKIKTIIKTALKADQSKIVDREKLLLSFLTELETLNADSIKIKLQNPIEDGKIQEKISDLEKKMKSDSDFFAIKINKRAEEIVKRATLKNNNKFFLDLLREVREKETD